MDDLDKLLNDLLDNPLAKKIEGEKNINLNDFENILSNPESIKSSTRPARANPSGSAVPRVTGLIQRKNIDPSFSNSLALDHSAASENSKKLLAALTNPDDTKSAAGKPLKMCAVCGKGIQKSGAVLNGRFFHNEHFTCNVCDTNLKGVLVFEKDDLLWCENDYHNVFSPECFYCKEKITDESGIEALGNTFHPDHFFCAQCGEGLVNKSFREYQGKGFCSDCYATMFASRCAHCLQPLLEDYISALSKHYHKDHFICATKDCGKVLDINGFYNHENMPYCEYHYCQIQDNICVACSGIILGRCVVAFGKKFHAAHFKCSFCTKELDGTEGGYKGKGGKAYCPACYVKIFS